MIDLEALRRRLIDQREALLREEQSTVADRAPVTLDQDSVGRLSRIDAIQLQAMAVASQQRRAGARLAIESALERMAAGEYGYCLRCGLEIAADRLSSAPSVTMCISCARGTCAPA